MKQNTFQLSNGVKFTVEHDFENVQGNINTLDAAFQNWLMRTNEYTGKSFVEYVKNKEPYRKIKLVNNK